MVDLKSQYLRIKTQVDNAISNVIDSTQFINGDEDQLNRVFINLIKI